MGLVVNTNIGALGAQRALTDSSSQMKSAMQRLSSGSKLNQAADDAAGFAIAERMTSQIRGLGAAIKNVNDGLSLLSVVENGTSTVSDMLQRMRELAIQAASDTNTLTDREYLQGELDSLTHEIDRIAEQTSFNNKIALNGDFSGAIQLGIESSHTASFSIQSVKTSSLISSEPIEYPPVVLEVPTAQQNMSSQSNGWIVNSNAGNASLTVTGGAYSELKEMGGLHEGKALTIDGTIYSLSNLVEANAAYTFDIDGQLDPSKITNRSGTRWENHNGYANNQYSWTQGGYQTPNDGTTDYYIGWYSNSNSNGTWRDLVNQGDTIQLSSSSGNSTATITQVDKGSDYVSIYVDAADATAINILRNGGYYGSRTGFQVGFNDPDTLQTDSVSMEASVWGTLTTQKGEQIWGGNNDRLKARDLSLDGNTMVVGASNASNNFGQVKVLDWVDSNWVQRGSTLQGVSSSDQFGHSVSISDDGNTLIASSKRANSSRGYVKIYEWNDTGDFWQQKGSTIYGQDNSDQFGHRVDLAADGKSFVVGTPYAESNDSMSYQGEVKVYQWNDSNWVQKGQSILGRARYDQAGHRVDLTNNGNTVAVSAIYAEINPDMSPRDLGVADVYDWNGSVWAQRGGPLWGENEYDNLGKSLAMSADGNTILLGIAGGESAGAPQDSGIVKVLDWNGASWDQRGEVFSGLQMYGQLGKDADISDDGNRIAIGEREYDGSGMVRIYDWDESQWKQIDSIDNKPPEGSNAYEQAWRVALSGDGSTLAIGADRDSKDGENNTYRGSVTTYDIAIQEEQPAQVFVPVVENTESQGPRFDILDITNSPSDALEIITGAIEKISGMRAEYGALQNRFEYTISNLMNVSEQTSAARSRLQDADFASESAKLAKAQILQQSGSAMIAQANASSKLALSLIK